MKQRQANLERFNAFSEGIFGVVITILALGFQPEINSHSHKL